MPTGPFRGLDELLALAAASRFGRATIQSGSALLGLVGIALLWAGLLHSLSSEHRQTLDAAAQSTGNLSRAFEEQIARSIKAVDQSLLFVRENYARDPAGFDISGWTRNAQAVTDLAIQLSLTDRHGVLRETTTAYQGPPVDLSDREHVRVHMNTPLDELFISKPVIGRVSGKWSIQFSRKIFDRSGDFDGVIVMSVDPTYFSRFFNSVDLGSHGAVALIGRDGVVRAAARNGIAPEQDLAIGQRFALQDLQTRSERGPDAQASSADVDGIRRITSYRGVSAYPLVVAVGISEDEVLASCVADRRLYLALGAVLTAFLLFATFLVLLHQRRLSITRERLRFSEMEYARKSHLLETALEHMTQGIMMVDGDHRVQVCNHRAVKKLNLPPELLARRPRFDEVIQWQWDHGEFGPEGDGVESNLRRFILGGGISNEPQCYERVRPSGTVLEIRSTPLPTGGVVRTYTDITVRKQAEEELKSARDQANSATRAKSEFLAVMSHEIRSPLSGLVGALDVLQQTGLDPDQAKIAQMANGSALTLLAILNDILDFSKIESGALTIVLRPTELSALVAEVAEPHRLVAQRNGVALEVRSASDVPSHVRTDALRLRQILNNLLSNAVKFTHSGKIDLSVEVVVIEGSSGLQFVVSDTGIGIDMPTLARLFEPFSQADGSSARNAGGTGLGLCISRRLAQLLDGSLTVTSEPGQGSSFRLNLPCVTVAGTIEPGESTPVPQQHATVVASVLVVDDDPTNQWLTKRHLEALGARVDTASGGTAALEALQTCAYDLVLTDCHMPGMDGVALTAAVRTAASSWSGMPIIGLTADVTEEQRARCLEAGMSEVVHKPLQRGRMCELLSRYLPRPESPKTSRSIESDCTGLAVFDPTTLQDLFGLANPEGQEWLGEYRASAWQMLADLREHVGIDRVEVDRAEIGSLAHRLIGSSLAAGAERVAAVARAIEDAAETIAFPALRTLLESLGSEMRHADAAMAAVLASAGPATPASGQGLHRSIPVA